MVYEFTKAALYGMKRFNEGASKKVKELMGMEKLIELLNEYEKEVKKSEFYEWEKGIGGPNNLFRRDTRDEEGSHLYPDTADTYVISKKYGFIGWLVENDKIDRDNQALQYAKSDLSKFFTEWEDKDGMSDDYAMLLMLLSIQDEPISFLCEILK